MRISADKTVRELAVEVAGATRVFEKLGIDYCCGGGKALEEACEAAGIPVNEIISSLEEAERSSMQSDEGEDWQKESLAKLTSYIVSKHHVFTRDEMDRIEPLLAKVCKVYGNEHPELLKIQAVFQELKNDLLTHMHKEEMVLFPYIAEMEEAITNQTSRPRPFFGTVRNPIRMMSLEHDLAGELLRNIRLLSSGFEPPADSCVSYQTLYRALEELEQDLHRHIHLENNILFPRATEMEDRS
ncbi:MAG TPA: iron-sulfur cluster repair di-iron protein [Blastocatellia bacterium]|nr:iron-sulfur cluster repair di-iron protein [Blastocatellia bacterium]